MGRAAFDRGFFSAVGRDPLGDLLGLLVVEDFGDRDACVAGPVEDGEEVERGWTVAGDAVADASCFAEVVDGLPGFESAWGEWFAAAGAFVESAAFAVDGGVG